MTNAIFTMGKELDLVKEQECTLNTPCLRSNVILKMMYWTMDVLYGKEVSWPKVKVLEILARYPYWAWENGGYRGLSRIFSVTRRPDSQKDKRYQQYVVLGRESQDNEEHHLRIAEEMIAHQGIVLGWMRHVALPRLMAFVYYYMTRIIFFFSPATSFYMNAAFESHAEHEYMKFAQAHPEWDREPVDLNIFDRYPRQDTVNNLIRRIALDERDHMNHSLIQHQTLIQKH